MDEKSRRLSENNIKQTTRTFGIKQLWKEDENETNCYKSDADFFY